MKKHITDITFLAAGIVLFAFAQPSFWVADGLPVLSYFALIPIFILVNRADFKTASAIIVCLPDGWQPFILWDLPLFRAYTVFSLCYFFRYLKRRGFYGTNSVFLFNGLFGAHTNTLKQRALPVLIMVLPLIHTGALFL